MLVQDAIFPETFISTIGADFVRPAAPDAVNSIMRQFFIFTSRVTCHRGQSGASYALGSRNPPLNVSDQRRPLFSISSSRFSLQLDSIFPLLNLQRLLASFEPDFLSNSGSQKEKFLDVEGGKCKLQLVRDIIFVSDPP